MGTSPIEEENDQNLKNENSNDFKEEDYSKFELLPTFNKISIVQALLKEMLSIKERFEENKNKMIEKIEFYCYKYYKNLLLSKEIYDNCKLAIDPSDRVIYILNKNPSKSIDKKLYPVIYKCLFYLRNNNKYILKIINNCHQRHQKTLSKFIGHFFYENTINSNNSFIQGELQLIIYFLVEGLINQNPEEILSYNKNSFLYRLIESLIKKADVRNYLNILLSDLILKIENSKKDFIIELIKKELSDLEKNKGQKKALGQRGKLKTEYHFMKMNNSLNKKDSVTIQKPSFLTDEKKKALLNRFDKKKTYNQIEIEKKLEKNLNNYNNISEKVENKEKDKDTSKDINKNELKKQLENIMTDEFFKGSDVDFKFIFEKLTTYENLKDKNNVSLAMTYFLGNHFAQLTSKIKEQDKYRNIYYFNIMYNKIEKKETQNQILSDEKYLDYIKKKYDLITNFITNLVKKLEETIPSMPISIKNLSNILDILIERKMIKKEKIQKIEYYKLMSKLKILIGNMLIPMIKKYESKRIFNDHILTRSTGEILKDIQKILNSVLLGKLFENISEPEYTIYNRFIIEIIPKLMNISNNLDVNIHIKDDNSTSIISKLINSFDKINDEKRVINLNELKDMEKENIICQSICFNWEILYILVKTMEKDRDFFINKKNNEEANKIFEDFLKLNKDLFILYKNNKGKKEFEFFLINKIIYKKEFQNKINSIIQDNYMVALPDKNKEIERFKKCLSEVLGFVGILHKEDFPSYITPKQFNIYSHNKTNLYYCYKRNDLHKKLEFEENEIDNKIENNNNTENNEMFNIDIECPYNNLAIQDRDRFFTRRKSVMFRWLSLQSGKKDNTDFKTVLFPQIISELKIEIGNSFQNEKSQRIIFCSSYVQTHFENLPLEYRQNNCSKIFLEILKDVKNQIQELQNNVLNEFYMKIRCTEKLNEIITRDYNQIKNMEKYFYIKYLYKRCKVYGDVIIEKNSNNIISKIKFEPNKTNEPKLEIIKSFLHEIPNFNELESKIEEDFLINQQKIGLVDTINNYFKELKNRIKHEDILSKLTLEEFLQVSYGLENYILSKLYSKCFPTKKSKEDIFFNKKCSRLSFIKPLNIIKDEQFKNINEKLLEISIEYVKELDNKKTPMDKITVFGKAMNFLSNSMQFNSGKDDLGVDDLLPLLIYIVIKANPEKLYTNYNYCMLYLNKDLIKKQYGSLLTQIGVIIDIIKNMKFNDLNNVTEEEFGVDEVI